ncbi:MAG: ATP-binding protein [Kibdelosporangium sp.]
MSETRNGHRVPAPSRLWAVSLPGFAADAVETADFDRPHLHFKVPASAAQLSILRACLRDWTTDIGMLTAQSDDVVLAVDEALTNAVEHAYVGTSGAVVLFAACDRVGQVARVVVSDTGTWRPPPSDPGLRGRGLSMMRGLAGLFDLHHDAKGTTVVLEWSFDSGNR